MGLKNKISSLKERSKVWRVILNKYFLVTLAFLVLIVFIDSSNVIKWLANERSILQQRRMIEKYSREIKATDERIKELTSNLDSLEKYAREHYYFQKKDEEVFIIE